MKTRTLLGAVLLMITRLLLPEQVVLALPSYTQTDIIANAFAGGSWSTGYDSYISANQSTVGQSFSGGASSSGQAVWCTPAQLSSQVCGLFEQYAGSSFEGNVDYGAIGVTASVGAGTNASYVDWQIDNQRGIIDNPYLEQGEAAVYGAWYDEITFGGLPSGTPVDVTLGLSLEGSVGVNNLNLSLLCPSSAWVPNLLAALSGMGGDLRLTNDACSSYPDSQTAFETVHVFVGQPYSLSGFLQARTQLTADTPPYSGTQASELASALHTSRIVLAINTPGVFYTSSSGTQYLTAFPATQVPEPSSFILLGMGFIVLASLCRLKTSRIKETFTAGVQQGMGRNRDGQ